MRRVSLVLITSVLIPLCHTPTFADVVVNNVLSPFTSIQVEPGYGYRRSDYYYQRRAYYQRPAYYGARHGRYGRCWVTTDKDRNYGYWDWCR